MLDRTRWTAIGAAIAVTLAAGVALPAAQAAQPSDGVVLVPIVPCRLFDTRPAPDNVGPRAQPLGSGEIYTQQVTGPNGNCNVPASATAIALNVTTVNSTSASYLTLWPADASQPLASNLNWVPGSPPTPNKVDVKLSADGKVDLFNHTGSIDVLADVVGYYTDHAHDDRYYTKAQVDAMIAAVSNGGGGGGGGTTTREDSYNGGSIRFDSATYIGMNTFDGCSQPVSPTFSVYGLVPLILPVGATLDSVLVSMIESSANVTYRIEIWKRTNAFFNATESAISGRVVGNQVSSKEVDWKFTFATPEVVAEGESFYARIQFLKSGTLDTNSFCGLNVTYHLPS